MDNRYLSLLAREFPSINSAASEIINLSAIRSLPKSTEYFFSDIHGEHEAFIHMLRSASGVIRKKLDDILSSRVCEEERENLSTLIYYPENEIKRLRSENAIDENWLKETIYRLVLVCERVSSKYTRSRVRKRAPKDMVYILDELLNVTDDINKELYYDEIIKTILSTGIAENFIISICRLIQSLALDTLHIIGDIFDRGPRADIIFDELEALHNVDIQWGNHDISWIGAVCGNYALVANVIRIAMRYNSFDLLEDGYGLNLRALAVFASEVYKNDDCSLFIPNMLDDNIYDAVDSRLAAKMHKAITVIQLKLEGKLIEAHPEWNMSERNLFNKVDFDSFTIEENGKVYPLKDKNFPTVDKSNPLELSNGEKELMNVLANSFKHSEKLNRHIRFILSHGSMYKITNGNLMFHGCIPMKENGEFAEMNILGIKYSGKALFDAIDKAVLNAYHEYNKKTLDFDRDFIWYLWCGENSPLYGKDKMAFFERTFLDDNELKKEVQNPYYRLSENVRICEIILRHFGLSEHGHIINGHVPVKIKDGESPVKAGGKLFVIDGGISKAYQPTTGIAGYTLIYDSHSLSLAEHKPFVKGQYNSSPTVRIVENMKQRVNISDTDKGIELLSQINDLRELLEAYKNGTIKEKA